MTDPKINAPSESQTCAFAALKLARVRQDFQQIMNVLEKHRCVEPNRDPKAVVEHRPADAEHVRMWNVIWNIEADLNRLNASLLAAQQA